MDRISFVAMLQLKQGQQRGCIFLWLFLGLTLTPVIAFTKHEGRENALDASSGEGHSVTATSLGPTENKISKDAQRGGDTIIDEQSGSLISLQVTSRSFPDNIGWRSAENLKTRRYVCKYSYEDGPCNTRIEDTLPTGLHCAPDYCCSKTKLRNWTQSGEWCSSNSVLCGTDLVRYPEYSYGKCTCDTYASQCPTNTTCKEEPIHWGGAYCECTQGYNGNICESTTTGSSGTTSSGQTTSSQSSSGATSATVDDSSTSNVLMWVGVSIGILVVISLGGYYFYLTRPVKPIPPAQAEFSTPLYVQGVPGAPPMGMAMGGAPGAAYGAASGPYGMMQGMGPSPYPSPPGPSPSGWR